MTGDDPKRTPQEPVSDAELAEIRRQLRGVIGDAAPEPPAAPPPVTESPDAARARQLSMVRFVAAPLLPLLVIVAIILVLTLV